MFIAVVIALRAAESNVRFCSMQMRCTDVRTASELVHVEGVHAESLRTKCDRLQKKLHEQAERDE